MNKTVASLALLKANWDSSQRKDYIENFIPFIATLINRRGYRSIKVNTLCKDFEAEYGLKVPYHPMIAIVNRAMKAGYVDKRYNGEYVPVKEKVVSADFTDVALEQERKYKKVLDRFLEYCKRHYNETLSQRQAEDAFVSFLKDHDLDILFINLERETLLPEVATSITQKFLMNSFVKSVYESDPEIFTFVVDISVGHIIANTLLCRDFEKFQGNLSECNFYLDIGFLFNIMGINGTERKEAYVEFVRLLLSNAAHVFIFQHTYEEFLGILEGCMPWVESAYYDPIRASRATIYFVESHFTSSDVEQFILGARSKLDELKIQLVASPPPMQDTHYQIDEQALTDVIVDTYRKNIPNFDEVEKEYTLYKDVKSISAIHKFRRGQRPTQLQEAKHIFVTTNSSLALACRVFELQTAQQTFFFIPSALTDVFVGTLVWIQSPTQITRVNEKRLIANCYAALQPTKPLIKKLVDTAVRLKGEGKIAEEDVTLLKQSRVARNLLQEETLGDPNRFTDKTVTEILDEIRTGIRREEQEKLNKEKEALRVHEQQIALEIEHERQRTQNAEQRHIETQQRLDNALNEKAQIERNIETLSELMSGVITYVFYVVSIIMVVAVSVFQFYPGLLGANRVLNFVMISIAVVLTVVSLITGFNVRGTGKALRVFLKKIVMKVLLRKGLAILM